MSRTAIVLHRAGEITKGEFRCPNCQYGIVVSHALPVCPMCRGEVWEAAPWRPYSRVPEVPR
jgi:rubrerythrin